MEQSCTLTIQESDAMLGLLAELPIKYLPVVQRIQEFLQSKFVTQPSIGFADAAHEPAKGTA